MVMGVSEHVDRTSISKNSQGVNFNKNVLGDILLNIFHKLKFAKDIL